MIAIDIHRGRDHGLPTYNDMRQILGIGRASTFGGFRDHINDKVCRSKINQQYNSIRNHSLFYFQDIDNLRRVYAHPDDVDLFVGGTMERLVPGTRIGITFLHVLTDQFHRIRVSDRFWFENFKLGFTPSKSICNLLKITLNHNHVY